LTVVRIAEDGSATLYPPLDEYDAAGQSLTAVSLVPDPRGGVHASWTEWDTASGAAEKHQRVGPGYAATVLPGPLSFDRIGDGVGFDGAGTAFDLDSAEVKYTPAVAGTFVAALAGGGVAVTDGDTLWRLDETGTIVDDAPIPGGSAYAGGAQWIDVDDNALIAYAGPPLAEYSSQFPDRNGVEQPATGWFETPQQAATEFFRRYFVASQVEQREFGGLVCKLDAPSGTPYTTAPFVKGPPCQTEECSVDLRAASCPPGTTRIEDFHTHPFNYLFEDPATWPQQPSAYDESVLINDYNLHGWRHGSYVGTFCGEVFYLFLTTIPTPPCLFGNVYQPPTHFRVFSTEMFGPHPQCALSSPPARVPLQVLR
jgi:hypothetical protein